MAKSDQLPTSAPVPMGTGKVVICSVYPHPKEKEYLHAGRAVKYTLAAAPANGFSICTCYDTFALTHNFDREDESDPAYVARPIPARTIAENLVREWAGDIATPDGAEGATIGIGIVQDDPPTPAELEYLRFQQNTYDLATVKEADGFWVIPAHQNKIGSRHRRSLEHLNLDPEGHPWYIDTKKGPKKSCPACAKPIEQLALKCEHCQTNLPLFYLEMGLEPPTTDSFVAKVYARLKAAKSPKQA